jgi:anti-sigma factor ChrR (cupin superfamily)
VVTHDENDEAIWSRACDYVLGSLTAIEAGEYERHLREGCDACSQSVRRAREMEGGLALAANPVAPRPGLRDELLAKVRAAPSADTQIWRRWRGNDAEWRLVRAEEGGFEPTKIAGIEVRRLSVDAVRQQVTMMIRMAPGTRYPPHRHGGREECFVLAGDLRHADQVMHGGDYEVVERGTIHGEQWTEGGCLLLIHSSMNDELLV